MSARILIVGFSVTEGGFGAKLKNALLHAGLASEVDVVGLGGNHPQGLMYLFDTVGSDQTYDHIVFEINTSDFRKYKSGAAAVFPFLVLAAKTRARGAEPLFINLPRGDVDPETDDTGRLRGIGLDRMDVANLDIDRQAYAHFGADVMRETFFKDDGYFVHPHGVNEDWLVRQSTEALSAVIGRPAGKTDLDLANSFSVLRLSDLRPDLPVYDFSRGGFSDPTVEIAAGETVTFENINRLVCGVTYLSWARAGDVYLTAGDVRRRIPCLDPWSYYVRVAHVVFPPIFAENIELYQDPAIPPITLKKGETSQEPRCARIGLLMVAAENLADIEKAAQQTYLTLDDITT